WRRNPEDTLLFCVLDRLQNLVHKQFYVILHGGGRAKIGVKKGLISADLLIFLKIREANGFIFGR
ncbi:hypothetical protein, partial [Paenibacillus macerans]|uniref:hypothetical protein n=1 Tax=Paenibacillus macerans TaxID=44252 RepID=UPI003D323B3E